MLLKNVILDSFISEETRKYFTGKDFQFPFEVVVSFKLLIEYIEKESLSKNKTKSDFAKSLLKVIEQNHELKSEIRDLSIIEKNEEIINNMMLFVFPDFFSDRQAYAAATPFTDMIVYSSPKFRERFMTENRLNDTDLNITPETYIFGKTIGAYGLILSKYYGLDYTFSFPIVHKVMNPLNGLDMYYKMNMANEFVNVECKSEPEKLSESDKDEIKNRIYDLEFLSSKIKPSKYKFTGFLILNMINISDTEILSAIKKELIEKDSITTFTGFLKLQHHLKSLINCPGLMLGLVDVPVEKDDHIDFGMKIGNSFCFNEKCNYNVMKIKGSIYERAIKEKKVVIIEDLFNYPDLTIVEENLIKQNIRNILIAPLMIDGEVIGLFEIVSPAQGKINQINSLKLYEVLPLFSMAVSRSKMERSNKIQAVIKEKCTAIHPSLEWKFKKAAVKLLEKEKKGIHPEMDEIIFNGVYPLYGLSDIRNSSVHRNNSIREDLIHNLELAGDVIDRAIEVKPMVAFNELKYKINKRINALKFSINSGDELEIIKFLKDHIVTLFGSLSEYGEIVKKAIDAYNATVDENLGFVYNKRKSYEKSASAINDMIASYLDEEQIKIQNVYPHYYERYKTDGVDHNIYIGPSMVKNVKFNLIYLKNVRLWQLITMCQIAVKSKLLELQLPLKLETAHLILVQNSPLTIRFRFDEKKFDVDGAYNVRYEILKKRIDKAEIKGREERLTQPGKIAIVYNQLSEASEYLEYIEYLQSKDLLKREIDELELEDLQGLKGLKALRVTVNQIDAAGGNSVNSETLLKEFSSLKSK